MCVTCGCSDDSQVTMTNMQTQEVHSLDDQHSHQGDLHGDHSHTLPDGTVIHHNHHNHNHNHDHNHDHNHQHSEKLEQSADLIPMVANSLHGTTIALEEKILGKNNLIAAQNRGWFKGRNILALNLVSSPGAGKTTLLTRTINDLKEQLNISVIEGDQATVHDAEKIRQTGCQVVQINTGKGCHLEANMVEQGYTQLQPPLNSVVMIENVGNLVCPALFDLGETAKVVMLSVTEGEDKPIKYPHIFRASHVMILTKIDLLPYVEFDSDRCLEYARQVNPNLKIFTLSAKTGEGLDSWYNWLKQGNN